MNTKRLYIGSILILVGGLVAFFGGYFGAKFHSDPVIFSAYIVSLASIFGGVGIIAHSEYGKRIGGIIVSRLGVLFMGSVLILVAIAIPTFGFLHPESLMRSGVDQQVICFGLILFPLGLLCSGAEMVRMFWATRAGQEL